MRQGDCNAPATFMKLMNWIFQDMLGRSVYVYLDDILIFSKTKEEHIDAIKQVCQRLKEHKLYGNKSKTMILPKELMILGHTMISDGIIAEPEKVLDVSNWKTPKNRKKLQGFMGMVNYLSTYVPHLATVVAPLTRLCGSTVPWKWTSMHDVSFKTVKDIISVKAILQPINYDAHDPIFLVTDASATGIGAWIGQGPSMHDIRPAAFYSRKFKNAENWYSVTDKELLAIIEGLEHFQIGRASCRESVQRLCGQ